MSKNLEIVKVEYKLQGGQLSSMFTRSCPPIGSSLTMFGKPTNDKILDSYLKCTEMESFVEMKSRFVIS